MNVLDPARYEPPPHECDEVEKCPRCGGDGYCERNEVDEHGDYVRDVCPLCDGDGEVPADLDIPHRWEL